MTPTYKNRKIRVVIQLGGQITGDYSTKQFIERDISLDVRDEEDMVKQLRFLLSDEYKAVEARLQKFPEARPLLEATPPEDQELIG